MHSLTHGSIGGVFLFFWAGVCSSCVEALTHVLLNGLTQVKYAFKQCLESSLMNYTHTDRTDHTQRRTVRRCNNSENFFLLFFNSLNMRQFPQCVIFSGKLNLSISAGGWKQRANQLIFWIRLNLFGWQIAEAVWKTSGKRCLTEALEH